MERLAERLGDIMEGVSLFGGGVSKHGKHLGHLVGHLVSYSSV